MAVTLADVATHAGVSRQTVSNSITNPAIVRAETLERVRSAIAELNYTPNVRARRLRQQRTGTIGLRVQPPSDNVASVLLDRFLHELSFLASQHDKHVLLFTAASDEEEVDEIGRLAAQSIADEFVLTGTRPGDTRAATLTDRGQRFVTFGRPWGDETPHAWVDVDGRAGTEDATRWLRNAGISRIGFLGWPSDGATGDDRRQGWVNAMGKYATEDLIATSTDDVTEAIEVATKLIDADAEAVVCASDTLATGMVAALRARGLSRPIIGFDNTPFAAGLGFSSIDQELRLVADAVLQALALGEASSVITPRLHIRQDQRWGLFPTAPTRPLADDPKGTL